MQLNLIATEATNAVENSERKQLSILLHLIAKWHVEKSVITSKYMQRYLKVLFTSFNGSFTVYQYSNQLCKLVNVE